MFNEGMIKRTLIDFVEILKDFDRFDLGFMELDFKNAYE